MRIFIRIFLLLFFTALTSLIFSQNELKWRLIPTAPYNQDPNHRIEYISFINERTGWVISYTGINNNFVFKTTDAGWTWSAISDKSFAALRSVEFVDSLNGWIGTLNSNGTVIYRTTDGGLSWISVISSTESDSLGVCGIEAIDKNLIYAFGRYFGPARFFKSTNGGINWSIRDLSAHASGLIDCHFFNSDSGFVVGSIGPYNTGSAVVLFTSDGGDSWVNRFTTEPRGQLSWKICFPDRQHGYVAMQKNLAGAVYFLKSDDGGDTWEEKIFLNSYAAEQGIGFINSQTGWIGGWYFNTYKTTNSGESWTQDPWGNNVNMFEIINDTLAYAVGRGVYKFSRDSIVSVSTISTQVPASFNLYQNFPNPFNPATSIKFDIAKSGNVKLVVFDMLGSEVKIILNEKLNPGTYQVSLDGSELSSGVYFYQLQSDNYLKTMKMLLVK